VLVPVIQNRMGRLSMGVEQNVKAKLQSGSDRDARTAGNKIAGRSIGATLGRYYSNWRNDDYRKPLLNAIVWTAHIPVPKEGVQSTWIEDAEVDSVLGPTPAPVRSRLEPPR
jgi:hypothetical protein